MATFRCYFLDADNHIRGAEVIDAKGLGEAIERGLAMLRQSPHPAIEIWEGKMKVFPASAERASLPTDS